MTLMNLSDPHIHLHKKPYNDQQTYKRNRFRNEQELDIPGGWENPTAAAESIQEKTRRPDMNNNPKLHEKTFRELTTDELYQLLKVRSEVFVVEQNCVYQDLDDDDQDAIHLWLTNEEKIVALARVCPAGTHMKEVSIGRVITTERGKGYGRQIMLHAIDTAVGCFGAKRIDIEAQEYAREFYEGVGFRQTSDTFMLDGIPHIRMTWKKESLPSKDS